MTTPSTPVSTAVSIDHNGGVAIVRLCRPPMNVLGHELRGAIVEAAMIVSADPEVRAVVLTGGDRALAAGADIRELASTSQQEMADSITQLQDSLGVIETIPKPTVAAIRGVAFGGGLELALGADWRIAADDARLGLPEVTLGLIPGGGGTQRLTRLIGASRAKEMLMTGRHVHATEALPWGLVDQVVRAADVVETAVAWARRFETAAPLAVAAAKRAANAALSGDNVAGYRAEQREFLSAFDSEDAQAGIISFLENGPGKAAFSGR